MKIAVIGAGSAGAISVLSILKYCDSTIKVDCIFDPNIPHVKVGESTSSSIWTLLCDVLDFQYLRDKNNLNASPKWGTILKNWNSVGSENLISHYSPGFHLDSNIFSDWCINRADKLYNNFNIIHGKVSSIQNKYNAVSVTLEKSILPLEYDYVMVCTGFPKDKTLYSKPAFESVNSVVACDIKPTNEEYTTATATEDGWMFRIPLPTRTTIGYLYNNKYTDQSDALSKIKGNGLRGFSWEPYYRNTAVDGRIVYNGNALSFFEPTQGLAMQLYQQMAENFIGNAKSGNLGMVDNFYHYMLEFTSALIALNYSGSNHFDSKFWNYCKSSAPSVLKTSTFSKWKSNNDYGFHNKEILKSYIEAWNYVV